MSGALYMVGRRTQSGGGAEQVYVISALWVSRKASLFSICLITKQVALFNC